MFQGGLLRVIEKDKRREQFDQNKFDAMNCSSSVEDNSSSSKYEDSSEYQSDQYQVCLSSAHRVDVCVWESLPLKENLANHIPCQITNTLLHTILTNGIAQLRF